MDFNADVIKNLQIQNNKDRFNKIIEHHYKKILSLLVFHNSKQYYCYKIEEFIPGFPIYNAPLVAERLSKKIEREHKKYKCLVKDSIIYISWKNSNAPQRKKFIENILLAISKQIQQSVLQNDNYIIFVIPKNMYFNNASITNDVKYILEKKKFKISNLENNENRIRIEW